MTSKSEVHSKFLLNLAYSQLYPSVFQTKPRWARSFILPPWKTKKAEPRKALLYKKKFCCTEEHDETPRIQDLRAPVLCNPPVLKTTRRRGPPLDIYIRAYSVFDNNWWVSQSIGTAKPYANLRMFFQANKRYCHKILFFVIFILF